MKKQLNQWFPNCRRILGEKTWESLLAAVGEPKPKLLLKCLIESEPAFERPDFIADLARIEYHRFALSEKKCNPPEKSDTAVINPELILLPVEWKNLPGLLEKRDKSTENEPESGTAHILIWRSLKTGQVHCRQARGEDLLTMKLMAENIDFKQAAQQGKTTLAKIMAVFYHALDEEILIGPDSRIKRNPQVYETPQGQESFLSTDVFTLQWHITQACDLHCRHCYDRSDRTPLPFDRAVHILDEFFDFARAMNVRGHVTFTGGNPLLYPRFRDLYTESADRGFSLAILGNPASPEALDPLLAIQPPTHYQISLEGLEPYNDYIRGAGHFKRSTAFLGYLKDRNVYSMVMLTLNKDNMDQVLDLAKWLEGRADSFTFNRLAAVGEGANLNQPDPDDFKRFLKQFNHAARSSPVISLKDNLINIVKHESGEPLFDGCTGYGCGAAFNFLSLLPDGEVHACRKFPSLIGNLQDSSLLDLYQSEKAEQYRCGSRACRGCGLFNICRGCMAVVYGMGLDCFSQKDPYCFLTA